MFHVPRYIWNIGKVGVINQSPSRPQGHRGNTAEVVLYYLLIILKHFDLYQRIVVQPIIFHVHSF